MMNPRLAKRLVIVGCVVFGLTIPLLLLVTLQIYGSAGDPDKLTTLKNLIDLIRVTQIASLLTAIAGIILHSKAKK